MSMTDQEKEDEKNKIENAPTKGNKNVLFITDVTQFNRENPDKHFHPIEKALDAFETANGGKFNIYIQSRYKFDSRYVSSVRLRSMIVKVYTGDVVPALKAMFHEHPEVVENPDHVMTMQGPMRTEGYKVLIDKLGVMCVDESVEDLSSKWNFEIVGERQVKEDVEKAAKKKEKVAKAAAKADKKA